MTDPSAVPANERQVHIGGLMRCCLATIAECDLPSVVGTVLPCKYGCSGAVVGEDGAWGWNRG